MAWSIDSILQDPMLERVGWALLHSAWQGAAIAVVLAGLLLLTRRSQRRYLLACIALILSLLAPAATMWITAESDAQPAEVRHSTAAAARSPVNFDRPADATVARPRSNVIPTESAAASVHPLRASSIARTALPYVSILWALGVILICVRHIGGLFAVRSLRRSATPISDDPTQEMMTRLLKRLAIRQAVSLNECARTTIPCVIGFCRPMILLPVGMIANLSPQYLESILAHELAHIRRHDYLVNLAQIAIETLLFYHPAIWWISKQIRAEREHCCDDLAVEIVGSATAYSEALTTAEEHRIGSSTTLALGATDGSLLHRITRILNRSPQQSRAGWPVASILLAIILATCILPMTFRQSRADGQTPVPTSQPSTAPATQPGEVLKSPPGPGNVSLFDAFSLEPRRFALGETNASQPPRIIYWYGPGPLSRSTFGTIGKGFIIKDVGVVDLRLDNPNPPLPADNVTGATRTRYEDNDTVIFNDRIAPQLIKVGSGTLQIRGEIPLAIPTTQPTTQPIPATTPSGSNWPSLRDLKSMAIELRLGNQALHRIYGDEHPIVRDSDRQLLHVNEYLANLSTISVGRQDDAFESRRQISEMKAILLQFFHLEHALAALAPADRRSQELKIRLGLIRQSYIEKKERLAATLPAAERKRLSTRFTAAEAVMIDGAKAPPVAIDLADANVDTDNSETILQLLRARLAQTQLARARLLQTYGPQHPQIAIVDGELRSIESSVVITQLLASGERDNAFESDTDVRTVKQVLREILSTQYSMQDMLTLGNQHPSVKSLSTKLDTMRKDYDALTARFASQLPKEQFSLLRQRFAHAESVAMGKVPLPRPALAPN